ncbi:MAG: DUF2344 domain-containing protein [Firmicutes bacterium]|nr:DUF2344 domain-containing protein [Bacillota bacterium]
MPKYVLEFQKKGLVKYTSHLDMLRLFKRAFKITGIPLEYSKGYNPHPKMGFAQPLSLGFTSEAEYLEFSTYENLRKDFILERLKDEMPEGIILKSLESATTDKTLASLVVSATYRAVLPLSYRSRIDDITTSIKDYLNQEEIIAQKREKKTKKYVDKDIKPQIISIEIENYQERIALLMLLDAGSSSNLNPELVIQSFSKFSGITLEKGDVEIERLSMKLAE